MGRRHKNTYIFAPRKTSHPVRTFFLWLLTLVLLGALTVFILNLATNSQVEYLTQRITVETLPNRSGKLFHSASKRPPCRAFGSGRLRAAKGRNQAQCVLHRPYRRYGGRKRGYGTPAAIIGHAAEGCFRVHYRRRQRPLAPEPDRA